VDVLAKEADVLSDYLTNFGLFYPLEGQNACVGDKNVRCVGFEVFFGSQASDAVFKDSWVADRFVENGAICEQPFFELLVLGVLFFIFSSGFLVDPHHAS
jgi:hypothetical protein